MNEVAVLSKADELRKMDSMIPSDHAIALAFEESHILGLYVVERMWHRLSSFTPHLR